MDGKIQRILFIEESLIRNYQAIHQTWFERGKQLIIKTFGKHRGVKLVGYLNYATGEVYCEEHDTCDAKVFLKFFRNVLSKSTNGKSVAVLDNLRIPMQSFFKDFQRKRTLEVGILATLQPKPESYRRAMEMVERKGHLQCFL